MKNYKLNTYGKIIPIQLRENGIVATVLREYMLYSSIACAAVCILYSIISCIAGNFGGVTMGIAYACMILIAIFMCVRIRLNPLYCDDVLRSIGWLFTVFIFYGVLPVSIEKILTLVKSSGSILTRLFCMAIGVVLSIVVCFLTDKFVKYFMTRFHVIYSVKYCNNSAHLKGVIGPTSISLVFKDKRKPVKVDLSMGNMFFKRCGDVLLLKRNAQCVYSKDDIEAVKFDNHVDINANIKWNGNKWNVSQ